MFLWKQILKNKQENPEQDARLEENCIAAERALDWGGFDRMCWSVYLPLLHEEDEAVSLPASFCLSLIRWSPELFLALLSQTLHIPQRHFTFLMKLKTCKESTVSFTVCRSQLLCSLIRCCGAFESSLFFPLVFPFPSRSCFLMWKIIFSFLWQAPIPLSPKLLFLEMFI